MALARWNGAILDDEGNALAGAQVEVRRETVGSPLASIFSDRDGATPLGNPFTAQEVGNAFFHAAGGAYRITVTSGAFSRTWRYVGVGLNSEQDGGLSGPGATTAAGQIGIFTDGTGTALEGAVHGSPEAPLTVEDLLAMGAQAATDAEIRASNGSGYVGADALDTAAADVALTDAATVAVDWAAGIFFTLAINSAFRTLGNPTNAKPGQVRYIQLSAVSGTRALIFGNQYLGELPTLVDVSTTKNYLLTIFCVTASHFIVTAKVSAE